MPVADIRDVIPGPADRPDHPDFWRISQTLLAGDAPIEEASDPDAKERAWRERVASVVDQESVTYAAIHRAQFAFGPPSSHDDVVTSSKGASLFIDGFVTGAKFQQAGGTKKAEANDQEK